MEEIKNILLANRNKTIIIKEYSVLEKEDNENKIIIWPNEPYWLYVNNETIQFIENINGLSLDELVIKYGEENEIIEILEVLLSAEVIYFFGDNERKQADKNYIIQYITFNITDSCNLFCKHCYIGATSEKKQFMTFAEAKSIIDKLCPQMIKSCNVIVSGGEALLNPNCINILKYFNKVGKGNLTLITNGTLITKEIALKLKEIKNLAIQVSLDGATKETHEFIRGENTYDKTILGIKNLASVNHLIYLSPIVTKRLYPEIDDYFALAEKLHVTAVFLQPVNNVGRAKENEIERIDDSLVFKKVVELYEKNSNLYNSVPGSIEVKYLTSIKLLDKCQYCGVGSATLCIQPNGDLYPCPNNILPEMKLGNAFSDNIREIWYESPILSKLRNINVNTNLSLKCRKCPVKCFCGGGCRGVTYQNTGNLYALSPTCKFEKKQRIDMLWCAAEKPELFKKEVLRTKEIVEKRNEETNLMINNH